MSWVVYYETPPTRGIAQQQFDEIDQMLHFVKVTLLKGHVIRGIDKGRQLDLKTPDREPESSKFMQEIEGLNAKARELLDSSK